MRDIDGHSTIKRSPGLSRRNALRVRNTGRGHFSPLRSRYFAVATLDIMRGQEDGPRQSVRAQQFRTWCIRIGHHALANLDPMDPELWTADMRASSRRSSVRASAYVESAVHARGPDLDQAVALLRGHSDARALDLGCGGGHVSFNLAPLVREIVAYDLSSETLAAVARTASERGLGNVTSR